MTKFFVALDFNSEPNNNYFGLFEYREDGKHILLEHGKDGKQLIKKGVELGMVEYSEEDYQKDLARTKNKEFNLNFYKI